MDFTDYMGWMYFGGGWELLQDFYQKQLKLNVVAFPILPSGPQAFGWFKKPIQTVEDMKGMKCRQTGMAGEVWQAMGFTVVNMPGGEIIPLGPARRDRLRRVGRRRGGPAARLPQRVEVPLLAGRAREHHGRRAADQWRRVEGAHPQHQEMIKSAANETFLIWHAKWQRQNADALKEMQEKHGVQILRTPPRS
jgi:TRAP-type mannitol/chloroaromatic compound transport system substrate-binding protein